MVSIRELHTHTGRIVREASEEPVLISDRGEPIAVLMSASANPLNGLPFPKRDRSRMPRVSVDSAALISEDRDR